MKRNFPGLLCTLVALLALSASGVAVAQSDMGNTSTAGSTFALGTVQSFGSDSVTILMDSGDPMTILLGGHTVGKQNLSNGSRVRIDYRNNTQGRPVAEEIEIGGGTPVTIAATPTIEAPRVEVAARVPADTARTEPIAATPSTYVAEPAAIETDRDTLPATASRLPAVALLGLLALAGGVAFRMAR